MNETAPQLNLIFAWTWILAGFANGMVLGLFFNDEQWLGGYASHKRRMLRLAHIAFFGLGAVNFMFYWTARSLHPGALLNAASLLFVLGGLTMPICCWLLAGNKRRQALFGIPVLSLISAAVLTLITIAL